MRQAEVFFKTEGTAWLKRNEHGLPIKDDLILGALEALVGAVSATDLVLEIGCSNGWRLKELHKRYGCEVCGIDPSAAGVAQAKKKGVSAIRGFAHSLPYMKDNFDIVIYGFCLYLCDRATLFQIAAEGDRVLRDGGLMVVYDFATPTPCRNEYSHKEGLWSYKQDYDQLFLSSPAYSKLISRYHKDGQTKATVLRKYLERGWPSCELVS